MAHCLFSQIECFFRPILRDGGSENPTKTSPPSLSLGRRRHFIHLAASSSTAGCLYFCKSGIEPWRGMLLQKHRHPASAQAGQVRSGRNAAAAQRGWTTPGPDLPACARHNQPATVILSPAPTALFPRMMLQDCGLPG